MTLTLLRVKAHVLTGTYEAFCGLGPDHLSDLILVSAPHWFTPAILAPCHSLNTEVHAYLRAFALAASSV